MKILQINNKFSGAGAENVMKTLGKGLSEKGYKVYYAVYENVSKERAFIIKNPSTGVVNIINKINRIVQNFKNKNFVITNPNKSLMKKISLNLRNFIPLEDLITKRSVSNIIKKIKPDIIHCHNILPSLAPISVAKLYDIPVIVTLHGYWPVCPLSNCVQIKTNKICNYEDWKLCNRTCAYPFVDVENYMKKLRGFFIKNVDYVVVVSNYVKNKLVSFSYPEHKIIVIHNGIDTDVFKPTNSPLRPKVLHVGRLSYHKGSHIFLGVAKKMREIYPQIEFILIGSGLSRSKSKQNDNVKYLDWLSASQLINMYSNALCTVVPSIWPEPHPLITLESMACKTPVIGSKLAGIKESIIDGKTGFLIETEDEETMINEISKKIIYFYENKKERIKMGENARLWVKKKFSKENMINQYIRIYKRVLS